MGSDVQGGTCGQQVFALPIQHRECVQSSVLTDLLRLLGALDGIAHFSDSQPVWLRQVRAGAVLFHEGSPAEALEFVHVGSFKTFTTAEDGYQQVTGFAERADVLGFDAWCMGRHPTSAAALEDSWVFSVRQRDLSDWCGQVPALSRALHHAASRQLARHSQLSDVMAAVAAEVRLARFLVHMAGQMQSLGRSPRRFVLRMTRRDLASHLGVAHETVSRSFSALVQWGCLRVNVREVEIIDFDQLKAVSRCTRGLAQESRPKRGTPARALPAPFEPHSAANLNS